MSVFENVPIEEDTNILQQEEKTIGNFRVLWQKWFWDGIKAESVIFITEEVINLSDEDLSDLVQKNVPTTSATTISQSQSGYTFVNYNFETSG